MNDTRSPQDQTLDAVADSIRDEQIDGQLVQEATDRVWTRLQTALGDSGGDLPLRSCEDFQALLPTYVAGRLSAARAMLVGDHTRSCVPCRRALIAARRGETAQAPGQAHASSRRRIPAVLRWTMAAAVLLGALLVGYRTTTDIIANHHLYGEVQVVDGSLQLVSDTGTRDLAPGDRINTGQQVRTTRGSGAMIRLVDGSTVELAERSELALRGRRTGTFLNLDRGNVIVHAAKQHNGNLFVVTNDCQVAVKGTIFSVNHGLKGSRVSVIEGEVEVRQQRDRRLLLPGEQVTTDKRLAEVPVAEEIAWSRNRDEHLALLRELTGLHQEMAAAADVGGNRTSTRLLDLAPADTVIYAAVPNVAEGMSAAYQVLAQQLEQSPTLRAWWQEQVVSSGVEQQLEQLFGRLQPYGDAIGDELAVAVPITALDGDQSPLLLGLLDDPASFVALLEQDLATQGPPAETVLQLVDDPFQANDNDAEWLLWVSGDVVAAAQTAAQLQAVATALDGGGNGTDSELFAHLRQAYQSGISWLVGLDLETVLATTVIVHQSTEEMAMLEQLGLLDATTLVLERHHEDDDSVIRAALDLSGPRRGVVAWLAAPAPMASLEFISPDASLVSAAVTKDAADMLDDLLQLLGDATPKALTELHSFEQEHGLDLSELAASLGGEAAFAIDGPLLPIPAWKLVVEVYDPDRLQHALLQALDQINQRLAAADLPGLSVETSAANGLTYLTIRHLGTGLQVVSVMTDGFWVMAPQRALLDLALQHRAAGNTITSSPAFRALLPTDSHPDFSAMVYRDLGRIVELLPASMRSQLPPEAAKVVSEGSRPSLFCIYGEPDRITLSGSGGSLLGPASMLGLGGLVDLTGLDG